MRTRVQKWGDSLAVRVPRSFAEELHLDQQSVVELSLTDGRLGFLIRRTCCERVKFSGDKFGPYHPTVDGCRQRIEGLTQRRVAG